MFQIFKTFFLNIVDAIAPPRTNFEIVRKLDDKEFAKIPEAPKVEGEGWISPLFPYKDRRIRALVWELKYKGNILPLEYIGRRMHEEIIDLISDIILFESDATFLLIPVPISDVRRAQRGYNQSEHIAKAIKENDMDHVLLYAPQWLQKITDTPAQSHSESKQERMENLIGCFEADPRVESHYIILIDDVVTTGSTLSEAKKTLVTSGARDVFAFTIAH